MKHLGLLFGSVVIIFALVTVGLLTYLTEEPSAQDMIVVPVDPAISALEQTLAEQTAAYQVQLTELEQSRQQHVALYGSIFFFGALIVFLLAAMFPNQTEAIVDWFVNHLVPSRFRVQILGLAKRFLSGLEALHSPAAVLMIFVTSVVIWLLETGKYWLVMQGFPFQVSFFTLMLMNGIVNLTTTIPSAPGYWGTFDKPGIEVLKRYAVPDGIEPVIRLSFILPCGFPLRFSGTITWPAPACAGQKPCNRLR